ncbi:MAG: hypothetical protein ATN35_07925 [Epulopiscium sp. Nele67-Bin004]|nr:MAG: hypothetical protein ATN35_07925 [Epulopiscium sp. Nele67-Bin004]
MSENNNVENLEQEEKQITEQEIKDTVESLRDYLPKLHDGLLYIVEKYRGGQNGEAHKSLVDATEGINWVIDVISILFPDKIDFPSVNAVLRNLVDGIENQDTQNIADVIEHEVLELVVNWQQIFNAK